MIKVSFTSWDVAPYDINMVVPVWPTLFVKETQTVHHFMNDNSLMPATSCKPYAVVRTPVSNWRRAPLEGKNIQCN